MGNFQNILDRITAWGMSGLWKIVFAIIIWVVGKKIIKYVVKLIKRILEKGTLDAGVQNFATSFIKFGLYVVLLLMVIDELGIQTTSLITLFGSAALAIGMSLQGSLSNFAGGILILIFKPFTVGDYIIVGSNEGTVTSIELLYTRLNTVDNKVIMIPNGALSNSSVVNVGAENLRRLDIEVGISYSNDIKKAKELLRQVIDSKETVIKDKEIKVIVKSLDESCVTLETRTWLNSSDYWDTKFELLEEYKEILDRNNIEIPFNQLDVHIVNEK
ncbi:MAG: mechanosensitive ion channel [Eubacteriales bacterium]|nr:mechanosensitive ion channel [Eubacteriales bacterium]